jgi:hypothetical protein
MLLRFVSLNHEKKKNNKLQIIIQENLRYKKLIFI